MGVRKVNRYLSSIPTHARVLKELKTLPSGARILDVGSSEEGIGTWVKRPFIGLDLAFPGGHVPQLRPVIGDATRLPFADRSFDLVTCVSVLESFSGDVETLCSELARVSKTRAIVVGICGPEAEESIGRKAEWCRRHGYPVPEWVAKRVGRSLLDPNAVRNGLARHGGVTEGATISTTWSERLFAAQLVMLHRLKGSTTATQPVIRAVGRLAPFELVKGGPPFERWFALERHPHP
jgi:SAM-dependent methyltransferase